jgi:glycine/D-amino acid oxidase-like deaminating enzyme
MLDAQAMRELTGSAHYVSGLYTPGTVMLQPAGYIRGLPRGFRRWRRILEAARVTGMSARGAGLAGRDDRGSMSPRPTVILTVNGHLESFGVEAGRLMQLFLFAVMTPRSSTRTRWRRLGGRTRWGITPSDPMGTTMRRIDGGQGGDRIVTRTCASCDPGCRPAPPTWRAPRR